MSSRPAHLDPPLPLETARAAIRACFPTTCSHACYHAANLTRLPFEQPVTFLIGENGSGKSSLLEAMAVLLRFNAEGGSRNFRFGTRESHSELHAYLRPVRGVARRDHRLEVRGVAQDRIPALARSVR